MVSIEDIYVYIFSWKKVTPNAVALWKAISPHFPHTHFINCDETVPAESLDVSTDRILQLDDSYYYGGQFETALKATPPDKILACVVGDVDPSADWGSIATKAVAAFNTGPVGVYAPNVYYTWHTAKGTHHWGDLYDVPNTDCTCWFIHPDALRILRRIPLFATSNLGWGIDHICIKEARRQGLLVARDYSTLVRQPQGTAYSNQLAGKQMHILLGLYGAITR